MNDLQHTILKYSVAELLAVTLIVCLLLVPVSLAQPRSSISAFMTCTKEDGSTGLCTAEGWVFAEGYSAVDDGTPAELESDMFTAVGGEEVCASTAVPSSIEVSLHNPNPEVGDRLNFSDFTIEAFDSENHFISGVPVYVQALALDGMLLGQADWDYVEIAAPGHASFIVSFYCEQYARVSSSVAMILPPQQ